ncbi:BatA domain-containing protein [Roseiconus lacunae]|uniref:BatA domain-containing protein n=1 Tax=Roseiconus lacunae TaxID=2605694 RepID=UPI0011F3D37A|nr:BatA domain-containing protein [Roseiconus lacunae]
MNFLNGTLLIAITAIGIPIALHLIARKEPRRVTFPSVRLLSQRFETNRSKMRVRRWWLLALRIAAIAALALALARPVSTAALSPTWIAIGIVAAVGVALLLMASVAASKVGRRPIALGLFAGGLVFLLSSIAWAAVTISGSDPPEIAQQQPVALAVIVDNSIESAWSSNNDLRSDRIGEAAKEIVRAAGRNSRVIAIDRSATPATFSADAAGAIAKIEAFEPAEVVQPLAARIEAAARVLATSDIDSRQIVIVSGMTESSFPKSDSLQSLRALLTEQDIRLTIWDTGPYQGTNRQLSSVSISNPAPAPRSPITVTSTLSMDAKDEASTGTNTELDDPSFQQEVTVECVLFSSHAGLPVVRNGDVIRPEAKPVDRVSVSAQPGRDVEIQLTLPPLESGLHHGAMRLTGSDALAVDDVSYFSIEILPPSRLLIVGDDRIEAEEFVDLVSAEANGAPSQYDTEISLQDDLPGVRLADFDGVVLLNPSASLLEGQQLESYSQSGKKVLIAAGPGLGNAAVELKGLLLERRWRVREPGTYLQISADSHPALASLLNLPGDIPFQDLRIHQYWQAQPETGWSTLMRYAGTEHPALLENASAGTLLLTTPIPDLVSRKPWNDLFRADNLWPTFALTRELTRYTTGRDVGHWSAAVGSPVALPAESLIAEKAATAPTDELKQPPVRLQWFPAGRNAPVPIEFADDSNSPPEDRLITIGTPDRSGIHWIRGRTSGLGFSVNLPRQRFSFQRVPESLVQTQYGEDLRVISSIEEMDWTSGDAKQTLPLWSPLMFIALAVFLLELILSNRFYSQRPSTSSRQTKQRDAA